MTQSQANHGSSARALATDLLAREEGVDEIMKDAAASAGCAHVSSAKAIPDGQESGSGLPKYQGIVPQSPPQSNGSLTAKAPGTPARSDALLSATVVQNAIEERAVRSRVCGARAGQGKENEEDIRGNDDAADDGGIAQVPNILTSNGVGLVPPSQPARAAGPETAKVPDAPLQQGSGIATPDVQKKAYWPRTRVASVNGMEVLQCARDIEGCHVFSWGCAHNYQLGDGGYIAKPEPKYIKQLGKLTAPFADLSNGADHALAIDAEGAIYAWGVSEHGRLGHGDHQDCELPSQIMALQQVRVVSADAGMYSSSCIDECMRVFTWGAGGSGQLGHGEERDEWIPRMVKGLSGKRIVQVSMGDRHSAAICADGGVYTWGCGESGQLGDGGIETRSVPQLLDANSIGGEVAVVSCGYTMTAVLRFDGKVCVWGSSDYGALGLGTDTRTLVPRVLSGGRLPSGGNVLEKRFFVSLCVGEEHAAAVTVNGSLYAWGQGCFGAVGKPPPRKKMHPPDVLKPRRVILPEGVKAQSVQCGANLTAVLCVDGSVLAMGDDSTELREVGAGLRAIAVRCGRFHTSLLVDPTDAPDLGQEGVFSWVSSAFSQGYAWLFGTEKAGVLRTTKYHGLRQGATIS